MAGGNKTNKNRKYGRWSKSPSNKAYKLEGRYDKNKRKRQTRDAKRKEAAKSKLFARHAAGKPVPERFKKRHGLK